MKLRQRWNARREHAPEASQPPSAPQRPRTASVDRDLAEVVAELQRRALRQGVVYGDPEFRDQLAEATSAIDWRWVSHRDVDILAGAELPRAEHFTGQGVIVTGGEDVKIAYINALRLIGRGAEVPPVFWVGKNFEYCGSTLPIPAEVDAADIYLFNHFADFFPIKDPLLVRVTAADQSNVIERFLVIQPQETMHVTLSELLPERRGAAVVEIRSTHPALTGNRHPRWRVWADLSWRKSFTSLHGAHDFGPDRVCESRLPLSEFCTGKLVLTLPNYALRITNSVGDVHWTCGGERGSYVRNSSLPVEEISMPARSTPDGAGGFFGYRYHGHGTSYWFAFEEDNGSRGPSLCGNHEVTVAQVENHPRLASDRRRFLEAMEEHGFLFWPHGLPVLDKESPIEFGFSFEGANPQIFDFVAAAFDGAGQLMNRGSVALPQRYHSSDDVLAQLGMGTGPRPGLLVISPDWKTLDVDPQHINAAGNLLIRNRETGDRDVTEFQSCWRNLNATIDGFPHWLHPSKGVVGRTNVVGHVRTARGLRTGLLVVNGAGNLSHSAMARVGVRLYSPSGDVRTAETEVGAFTHRLLWTDEAFHGLRQFLGDEGYGTAVVTCADADVNCQIVTCSEDGCVSLQHLWGY